MNYKIKASKVTFEGVRIRAETDGAQPRRKKRKELFTALTKEAKEALRELSLAECGNVQDQKEIASRLIMNEHRRLTRAARFMKFKGAEG